MLNNQPQSTEILTVSPEQREALEELNSLYTNYDTGAGQVILSHSSDSQNKESRVKHR